MLTENFRSIPTVLRKKKKKKVGVWGGEERRGVEAIDANVDIRWSSETKAL